MRVPQTLFVLVQGAALVQSVSWTLHRSCYQNEAMRGDMLLALKDAAAQAALAAEKLRGANYLPPIPGIQPPPEAARRIREVAEFLIPNFLANVETVIARFEEVGRLGEPVGKDQGFADSQAWKDQETGPNQYENYRNFLIVCAPDITETTDDFHNAYYVDNLRKDKPDDDSTVLTIYKDIKAGSFATQDNYGIAVTRRSPINPGGGLRKIPEVIYLHGLWLEDLLRRHNSLLLQQADVNLVMQQNAAQEHRNAGSTIMDTLLNRGVEGTLLHEMFHLTSLGRLHDIPGGRLSYGWRNNVNAKNIDNADLMALLGLAVKMIEKGYRVDQEGMVTRY